MRQSNNSSRTPQMELIGLIYRLHGGMRTIFAGPNETSPLVLLEALVLGTITSADSPPTVSEIGRTLGYSRQSVQRAMNKLVKLGFVLREENPRHKRVPIFRATGIGRDEMYGIEQKMRDLAVDIAQDFSGERAQFLVGELTTLLKILKDHSRAAD